MKKNKMNLSRTQFPEQVVESQIDSIKVTEEEQKKKKGIIAWFKRHKGLSITGVTAALVLLISIPSCNYVLHKDQKDDIDLPENPGYENMQEEKVDNNEGVKPVEPTVVKKACECVEENCLCDDDEIGCECTEFEHEESCVLGTPILEDLEKDNENENIPEDSEKETENKDLEEKESVETQSTLEEKSDISEDKIVIQNPKEKVEQPILNSEHICAFGEWQSISDSEEQRVCECGKKEVRAHNYVDGVSICIYENSDNHKEIESNKCSTCGHVKETSMLKSHSYILTSYDAQGEKMICNECVNQIKRSHVFDNGTVLENGSNEYACVHQDCGYKKVVEPVKEEQDKNHNSTDSSDSYEPSEPSRPTDPVGPSEPSKPTDPVGPSEPSGPTDPVGPSEPTGPTGPTDPVGPSEPSRPTDPVGPSEEPDRDHTDDGGIGSDNVEDGGSTDTEGDGFESDAIEEPSVSLDSSVTSDETVQDTGVAEAISEGDEKCYSKSLETELQTLYTMREMVVDGITSEYSESKQYVLKK